MVRTRRGRCDGRIHIVYGPQRYSMELPHRRQGLNPVRPDVCFHLESSDGFPEEAHFLILGFSKGYMDLGTKKSDRKTGKTGTGTEIEERVTSAEVPGGKEALAEVAADDLSGIADRREVGSSIPLEQKIQIKRELRKDGLRGIQIRGRAGLRWSIRRASSWELSISEEVRICS